MRSFRIAFNPRAASLFAVAMLVFAALIPALASAATVTSRSIALSSSVKNTDNVSYNVKFTVPTGGSSTGAFALQFCDTPTVDTACANSGDSSGIDTTAPDAGTDTATAIGTNGVKVVLASARTAGQEVNVTLTGIDNPTNAGVFYARIVTYTDNTAYSFTDAEDLGTYLDDGSVALTTTDGFGVSGRALETLVFCAAASGDTIGTGCSGTLTSPSLTLGTNGILDTTASTGIVKTQISTNAAGGAVVNLKSNTVGCGGLARQGAASFAAGCGITPLTSTGVTSIVDNSAKFGLKLAGIGAGTGTVQGFGNYNATDFYMGWVSGDATGVTSTYGDTIYDTDDAPVSDGTVNLTFGANISNVTPAGNYSATLNLIATGKF